MAGVSDKLNFNLIKLKNLSWVKKTTIFTASLGLDFNLIIEALAHEL